MIEIHWMSIVILIIASMAIGWSIRGMLYDR